MVRQIISSALLIVLSFHGANNVGIADYIYAQRSWIAFELGIINEIPVAQCNADYESIPALHLHDIDPGQPINSILTDLDFQWCISAHANLKEPILVFLRFIHNSHKPSTNPPNLDYPIFHPPA
jgi:hypothetical protein